MMFGWRVNPHFGPIHIASFVLTGAGFWTISVGWAVLHAAQQGRAMATTGIYERLQHSKYVGSILILTGFCCNGRRC